jgi:queuine tRNA-ribosyltransferase
MLGAQLATIHNLHFYLDIMRQMREAIEAARFEDWRRDFLAVRLEGV